MSLKVGVKLFNLSPVVKDEGVFKVASVVQRLGLGEDGFHKMLVTCQNLKKSLSNG